MAANDENDQGTIEGGSGGGAGAALRVLAIFAAGAGAAVGVKALIDSRRASGDGRAAGQGDDGSDEDLPTVLRRAALDVALAATSTAADRLGNRDEEAAVARSGAEGRS